MSMSWKDEELRVAKLFGQRRRPLSGMSTAGLGLSDTMNLDGTPADLFIEVKQDKSMMSSNLRLTLEETISKSDGKPWIVTLHYPREMRPHRRFVVCDIDLFIQLWNASKVKI